MWGCAILRAVITAVSFFVLAGCERSEHALRPVAENQASSLEQVGALPPRQASDATWKTFDDCTYYAAAPTQYAPIDVPDSQKIRFASGNDGGAMNAHESLKVHEKRQLLAGIHKSPAPVGSFSTYSIGGDCR
jgi:hypothetical protein